jgi:hypothetical protein
LQTISAGKTAAIIASLDFVLPLKHPSPLSECVNDLKRDFAVPIG